MCSTMNASTRACSARTFSECSNSMADSSLKGPTIVSYDLSVALPIKGCGGAAGSTPSSSSLRSDREGRLSRTSGSLLTCKPLPQFRPPPPSPRSLDSDRQRLPLPDEHHQALPARHARIDQVPLQHWVVLRRQRDDHSRVFRPLALVDCCRIGQHQLIELAKAVSNFATLEVDAELAFLHVDARHDAEVAVVHVLVVVVLDLHHLVARAECPAEALDADIARRVQRVLQLDIERASPEAAAVHRAEHLNVADRVKPEAFRDALPHDCQQLSNPLFRVRRVNEVEVAAFGSGEIGHHA